MPRHVTVDALKRAQFPLVELCDECWSGKPQLNPTSSSDSDYKERVGPFSGFRLEYGEIADDAAWLWVESGWPGEYGRRDKGDGFVQVYTNDRPPEEAARTALCFAASFSQPYASYEPVMRTPPRSSATKPKPHFATQLPKPSSYPSTAHRSASVTSRALGLSAAAVNLPDRAITVSGRFEPNRVALQTADITRYTA